MKAVFGYLFNTGHGVLVCQLVTSVMSFLGGFDCIPKLMGGICFIVWLVSLVLVAVMVPVSLFRRRWAWAAMQLFGGLLLLVLWLCTFFLLFWLVNKREYEMYERSKTEQISAIPDVSRIYCINRTVSISSDLTPKRSFRSEIRRSVGD